MNVDHTQKFTVVEFCAGYSGISLGLKRAIPNLRVIAISEIEAFAVANLVAKMEAGLLDPAPVWPDLKTFPNKEFHGRVDLLVAGFPCQPFSAAGKRAGSDDPRHLFPYIKQSLIDMRPGRVFLENVEGIISSKLKCDGWADPEGTSVLLHVLRELERVGYRATAGAFSASEVGAPHQRKRVFIYGELAECEEQRRERGTTGGSYTGFDRADKSAERSQNGCAVTGSSSKELADSGGKRSAVGISGQVEREEGISEEPYHHSGGCWPSRPGEPQYDWEPPRVVVNPESSSGRGVVCSVESKDGGVQRPEVQHKNQLYESVTASDQRHRKTQPPMGRDSDGLTDRLDDAELYSSCDNRTDELRLLGNGVVPATAERAWRVLTERLDRSYQK